MHKNVLKWGILVAALGMPNGAFAITGCSTASLQGYFGAQVSNYGLQTFLAGLNATTPNATPAVGFANNAASLTGKQTAGGRYYFDGAGNILGTSKQPGPLLGKYTVGTDCTAQITMNTGAKYNGVVVQHGKGIYYVRTDADGAGNLGTLMRSGWCSTVAPGSSYGFSFSGANSPDTKTYAPVSIVGSIQFETASFDMKAWAFVDGKAQSATLNGTYTVGSDCSVSLKFSPNAAAPISFSGIMVDTSNGLITLQLDANTVATGPLTIQ